MSTEPAPRARRRTEPLRNERPINKRKSCDKCLQPRTGRQFRDLGGHRSTTCIACERPVADARTLPPKRRWCLACDPPREKTAAAFAPGDDRCRKCVRDGAEIQAPKPVSRKRLCLVCGDHRHPSRFERHGGVVAETCDLCASDPDIRVTLRQEAAAAVVLRALRQIRAARLDEASTCPMLGVEALRQLAADALAAVEAAR